MDFMINHDNWQKELREMIVIQNLFTRLTIRDTFCRLDFMVLVRNFTFSMLQLRRISIIAE